LTWHWDCLCQPQWVTHIPQSAHQLCFSILSPPMQTNVYWRLCEGSKAKSSPSRSWLPKKSALVILK
jgi:hypothetical protein